MKSKSLRNCNVAVREATAWMKNSSCYDYRKAKPKITTTAFPPIPQALNQWVGTLRAKEIEYNGEDPKTEPDMTCKAGSTA